MRRGSRRLFVLWARAKTPTGVIAALSSPATDALGRAGFGSDIDTHFWERFGSALLLSIVSDASSIARQQLQDSSIQINNTMVTQGTSIPCVLETAISSDVAGFVSCVVMRDVMSDSGNVVLP